MESSELDAVFFALAHPVRREILARLANEEATVNELAAPFDMSLPAVSKHIRVLTEAGLVMRGKDAQFRPVRLNAQALEAVAHWTEQYRHIWDARFDKLANVIDTMKGDSNE